MSSFKVSMEHSMVLVYSAIVTAITLLIYLPIAIYGFIRFTQHQNSVIIRKRYPQITFVICILLINTIIAEGLRACFEVFRPQWQWWTFHPIISFLSSTAAWVMLKAYLNYYSVHYSKAMIASEWKQIINPDTKETNWFILHRLRYGSYSFWKPIAIFNIFFLLFTCYIWEFTHPFDEAAKSVYLNWVGILNALICIVFMIIIRSKTPKFNDIFNQRHELRRIIISGSVVIALKIILHTTKFFVFDVAEKSAILITEAFLFATLSVYLVYTLTIWVIAKNQHWLQVMMEADRRRRASSPNIENIQTPDSKNNHQIYKQAVQSLDRKKAAQLVSTTIDDILATNKGFEALLFHFAQEFSIETILCSIEMTQFQQALHEYFVDTFGVLKTRFNTKIWLNLPPNAPKSAIVHCHSAKMDRRGRKTDTDDATKVNKTNNVEIVYEDGTTTNLGKYEKIGGKYKEFVKKAGLIYQKYVKVGSQFEVNVSYKVRQDVTDTLMVISDELYGDIENGMDYSVKFSNLYQLFVPTMESLYRLSDSTIIRFRESALFEKLVDENSNKK